MAATAKATTTLVIGSEGGFQIPVSLKKITQRSETTYESASPDGHPLKQVQVDLMTGEMVANEDIRKGVFAVKPKAGDKSTWSGFREVSKEDRDLIDDATHLDAFVVEHFIPLKDVPFERVTDAYFLAPTGGDIGVKALVLLAKTLRKTKRAGVFKLCKSSRQYLAVVYEKSGGLMVNTLAFSGDFAAVREASEALDRQDVKAQAAELDMAAKLVEAYSADADVIDAYEDDLVPLRAELVEKALSGKPLPKKKAAPQPVLSDGIEDLLRASLKRVKPKRSAVVA